MNRRRLAQSLADHAVLIVPPERRDWTRAMSAELAHIQRDGPALAFAFGAVWTSYRLGARRLATWTPLGRWSVGGATMLLGLGVCAMPLILQRAPITAQPPAWLNLIAVVLGAAYLAAGWTFARRRTVAFAVCLSIAAALVAVAATLFVQLDVATSAPRFYRALLLEECVFLAGLVVWAVVFREADRRLELGSAG